jgi:hypothetical protein
MVANDVIKGCALIPGLGVIGEVLYNAAVYEQGIRIKPAIHARRAHLHQLYNGGVCVLQPDTPDSIFGASNYLAIGCLFQGNKEFIQAGISLVGPAQRGNQNKA